MRPGELRPRRGNVALAPGRRRITISVHSAADRRIGVGSHYPFAAANAALEFDREAAGGMHLDVAAGEIMWFEPRSTRTVTLVAYARTRGALP